MVTFENNPYSGFNPFEFNKVPLEDTTKANSSGEETSISESPEGTEEGNNQPVEETSSSDQESIETENTVTLSVPQGSASPNQEFSPVHSLTQGLGNKAAFKPANKSQTSKINLQIINAQINDDLFKALIDMLDHSLENARKLNEQLKEYIKEVVVPREEAQKKQETQKSVRKKADITVTQRQINAALGKLNTRIQQDLAQPQQLKNPGIVDDLAQLQVTLNQLLTKTIP